VDGRQRRLLYLILISLSALLLIACTPAAPLLEEVCPVPVNLSLEDEPGAPALLEATVPEAVVTGTTPPETPQAPAPEKAITAAPKAPVPQETVAAAPKAPVPQETVAAAPTVIATGDPPLEVAPAVVTGPPPVIVSHTPGNTAGVEWSQDIRILFSRPTDRAATERAITVTAGGREYEVSWYRDDKLIRLVPSENWIEFEWYEVNIGADAAAADGARLGADYSFTFWGEEP